MIRPSCFLAASADLGEKGHEVKPEKWWNIGAKPGIDFSKPGLALVNLVYTRKVHCLLEKYQIDKSKSWCLKFSSLVKCSLVLHPAEIQTLERISDLNFTAHFAPSNLALFTEELQLFMLVWLWEKFLCSDSFYKIGLGRCRWFFLLSLTPLWPNSERRETQKCQLP